MHTVLRLQNRIIDVDVMSREGKRELLTAKILEGCFNKFGDCSWPIMDFEQHHPSVSAVSIKGQQTIEPLFL